MAFQFVAQKADSIIFTLYTRAHKIMLLNKHYYLFLYYMIRPKDALASCQWIRKN